MELKEAIYHRRAVRAFTGEPVGPDAIMTMLDAAVQAPSAMNLQPWAFGVFCGRVRLHRFSERAKTHLLATLDPLVELHSRGDLYANPEHDIFHGAETLIVIYAAPTHFFPTEDCCLAAENLLLTAYSLGLGSCPIGFIRPWLNLPEVKGELGISDQYTAVFPIAVGHTAEPPAPVEHRAPAILSWPHDEERDSKSPLPPTR